MPRQLEPLLRCFLEALRSRSLAEGELHSASLGADGAALRKALQRNLHAAQKAWPALSQDWESFVRHLAIHVPLDRPIADALGSLHATDLALAYRCGIGDRAALAEFERLYASDFSRALGKLTDPAARDEIQQGVRQKLFVGTNGHPKIFDYSGKGRLKYWVRVTVMRTMLDSLRGAINNATSLAPDHFLAVPSPQTDPETEYLKRLYQHEFQDAFEGAVASLSPESRNILRAHYTHDMSIDQLAVSFGIHRATAARRLNRARDALLSETRRILGAKLNLASEELDSVLRVIESQLHVSLHRLLDSEHR